MRDFNLFKKLSETPIKSLPTTLEELKKDARTLVSIRTGLTAQIWKLNIQMTACKDPAKLERLRAELTNRQAVLQQHQSSVLLDHLRNKEIEELGDSAIGTGSPFII